MTMTTVEVLRAARKEIADVGGWMHGLLCGVDGRVCALGAMARVSLGTSDSDMLGDGEAVYVDLRTHPAVIALARAEDPNSTDPLATVFRLNDGGGHAQVLAAFDRAIANEEAREAEFTGGVEEIEPVATGGEMVLA